MKKFIKSFFRKSDSTILKGGGLSTPGHSRDQYEFLPAVLEITQTPPLPLGRIIAITISAFFIIAILWASIGSIDIIAVSQGKTIPTGNVKNIQPLETGVIRAIHIEDGSQVKKGDLLFELDPTEPLANLDSLNIDLQQAELERALAYSLLQQNPMQSFIKPQGINENLIEATKNQLTEEYASYQSSLQKIKRNIESLESMLRNSKIERTKLQNVIPLIEEQLEIQQSLLEKGITKKITVQTLKQEMIEKRAELSGVIESYTEITANIGANKAQLNETIAIHRVNASKRYQESVNKISLLEQSILKEKKRLSYLKLKSPVNGVVQQLSVHTIGAVVSTGELLLVIVPDGTSIEIESFILNKDIGFVEEGQSVDIKFEAFPFTRYGVVPGKLMSISNDAILNEQLGPVYKAKTTLDKQQIKINNKEISLSPGMNASVEIKTGSRKIIDFFLSPIMRYKDEAIRER